MATEIYVNNIKVDIEEDEIKSLEYNIQVHDIASVNSVNSSFSTLFDIPRTSNNVKALEGLGLASDTSRSPYTKINADLVMDGITLVRNGWVRINKTTSTKYSLNIESGIVDFFAAIANDTIEQIDISELNHLKTIDNILKGVNRFQRYRYSNIPITKYYYFIADYADDDAIAISKRIYNNTDLAYDYDTLNVRDMSFMVPSAEVKYIWEQIFAHYGYTFSGEIFERFDFTSLYITYPKSLPRKLIVDGDDQNTQDPIVTTTASIVNDVIEAEEADNPEHLGDNSYTKLSQMLANNSNGEHTYSEIANQSFFGVARSGNYRITIKGKGTANYQYADPFDQRDDRRWESHDAMLSIGGQTVVLSGNEVVLVMEINGGQINFITHKLVVQNYPDWTFLDAQINYLDVKFEYIGGIEVNFSEVFKNIKINEFVKEIMWQFSLTPFIDEQKKHIEFKTLNERVNTNNVIDWSPKYITRVHEEYELPNYAQRNNYIWKYNDGQEKLNDGYFDINNSNLEVSKVLFNSNFYAPNNDYSLSPVVEYDGDNVVGTTEFTEFEVNKFPLWQKIIKEEKVATSATTTTSNISIEYKELGDRFYFIRPIVTQKNSEKDYKSVIYYNSTMHNGIELISKIGDVIGLDWHEYNEVTLPDGYTYVFGALRGQGVDAQERIDKYYKELKNISNNTRIHTISLALTSIDIANVDMTALYYFEQEQSYYLLNSLKYSPNGEAEGEFIKITR